MPATKMTIAGMGRSNGTMGAKRYFTNAPLTLRCRHEPFPPTFPRFQAGWNVAPCAAGNDTRRHAGHI